MTPEQPPGPNELREEPLGWTGLPTGRQLWGCVLFAAAAMSVWALLDWAFPFAWWR